MISAPPVDGNANQLCDWLELAVLASTFGRTSVHEVNVELEIAGDDFEAEDIAEEDEVRERRVTQVVNAISERMSAMGASYPFERTGDSFGLRSPITEGGAVYLFCLIVSNGAKDGHLHDEGPWKPDLSDARRLFQACATVCASGFVAGPAYSVGWPRSDASTFMGKLSQVYSHFRDGRPHPSIPSWGPTEVKDDEIDVIAWKHEEDGRPGTMYLLAQAASGANWRDKSLKNAIDTFHATWFFQQPASHPMPGLIMPFFLSSPADASDEDFNSQEKIEGEFWRTVKEMGNLLYRFRVARYVDVGVQLHGRGISPIEEIDRLPDVRVWVDTYRTKLQKADEALR